MRRARAIAAALGAVTLAGCGATIPESGPIIEGPAVGLGAESRIIRVIARPPAPGASPVEIVSGFLEATASVEDDYEVARQYLTSDAAAVWKPTLEARVYDGAAVRVEPAGAGRVSVRAPLVGRIDASGSYTVAEPGRTENITFGLVRESGQWRISAPTSDLLISRGDVERGYRTFDVYFLTPQFDRVVADPITVPSTGAGAATTLIRRLLAGPTDWLAPAVRTAFPVGTELEVDSVPVDGGVADVSLNSVALTADERTRAAMSAQIVWTLRQVPEVTGVRIRSGGLLLQVAGQPSVQSVDSWSGYDPDTMAPGSTAMAITERGVVRLLDDYVTPIAGPAGKVGQPLASLAVSADGTRVAGLDAQRQQLFEMPVIDGADAEVRAKGRGMSSVAYGPDGTLWWVESGEVRALTPETTEAQTVVVDGIARARVVDLAVSRDGCRAALLVRRGPRTEVVLTRVERRGEAVRLSGARPLDARLTAAVDVGWESASTVVVLGTEGAGPMRLARLSISSEGPLVDYAPEGSTSVAAAPGREVLVATDEREIRAYDEAKWRYALRGSAPAYPA